MAHPLDAAFLRIGRAQEHLADLKTRIEVFVELERKKFRVQLDPQHPEDLSKLRLHFSDTLPPDMLGVLTGEIIYNLRVALDYLIYALAERDSGKAQIGTQFPIEDTPEGFARREKTFLNGVNAAHIAQIEGLQPYKRCQWTYRLRSLSNIDKHRHLIRLKGSSSAAIRLSTGSTENLDTLPGGSLDATVQSAYDPTTHDTVHVQHHTEIRIGFYEKPLSTSSSM